MIPLFINGIFLIVLVLLEKVAVPSGKWADEREHRKYQQELEIRRANIISSSL